jgi:hypothetical protein
MLNFLIKYLKFHSKHSYGMCGVTVKKIVDTYLLTFISDTFSCVYSRKPKTKQKINVRICIVSYRIIIAYFLAYLSEGFCEQPKRTTVLRFSKMRHNKKDDQSEPFPLCNT